MIDSVSPASIHEAAARGIAFDIVLGYADGGYGPVDPAGWTAEAWTQFPGKTLVKIATQAATVGADAYDCERGNFTPAEVPGILRRERDDGRNPALYSDHSTWPAIVAACEQAGLAIPPRFDADPTGTSHLTPGSVATQYAWLNSPNVDLSLVADGWPHPVAPPHPLPPPPPPIVRPIPGEHMKEITLTINVEPNPSGSGSAGWTTIGEFVDAIVSVDIGGEDPLKWLEDFLTAAQAPKAKRG